MWERLFTGGHSHREVVEEPVFSVQELEDLFDALLLIQSPNGNSYSLKMGRAMTLF